MGSILGFLAFLILISVLVAVHELGHLIAARCNGVFVEVFSIGYGPKLFEYKDKYGTLWRFSWLLFGGYVRMFGDADVSSVKEKTDISEEESLKLDKLSLHRKKPWQKLIVAVSGPVANFIFAILTLLAISFFHGQPIYDNHVNVTDEGMPAYQAGIRSGDMIISANGKKTPHFEDIKNILVESIGKEIFLKVERDGKEVDFSIKLHDGEKPIKVIGITPYSFDYEKIGLAASLKFGVLMSYKIARDNIVALCQVLTAKRDSKDVGGVIYMFKMAKQSAESGFFSFVWIMSVLSVILGAINLLPIPVLDGGTVVISAIEWVIGTPLPKKFIEIIFTAGLCVVAGLMLFGIWNDLSKLKFFSWLESLFK